MAFNYDLPPAIYPKSGSRLSTGEGLGVTHANRTPYERAMRNLYMRANRNRAKDPKALLEAAALAEDAGIDVSGSLTAASQANTRNQRLADIEAMQAQADMPRQARLMRQSNIRQQMRAAASRGEDLSGFRDEAISEGAQPAQFDRAARVMAQTLRKSGKSVVDRTGGGPVTTGKTGVDDNLSLLKEGQAVIKTASAKNLPKQGLAEINAGKATVVPAGTPPPTADATATSPDESGTESDYTESGQKAIDAARMADNITTAGLIGAPLVGTLMKRLASKAAPAAAAALPQAATAAAGTVAKAGRLATAGRVGLNLLKGANLPLLAASIAAEPAGDWLGRKAASLLNNEAGLDAQLAASNAAAAEREKTRVVTPRKLINVGTEDAPKWIFQKMKKGGMVAGKDKTRDIPALVMKGEYVMQKSAVDKYGQSFMKHLNDGRVRKDAHGRFVYPKKSSR